MIKRTVAVVGLLAVIFTAWGGESSALPGAVKPVITESRNCRLGHVVASGGASGDREEPRDSAETEETSWDGGLIMAFDFKDAALGKATIYAYQRRRMLASSNGTLHLCIGVIHAWPADPSVLTYGVGSLAAN